MAILDSESKKMLVESMRKSICNVLSESTTFTAKDAETHKKFVNENATYEQLLNITMNPDRGTHYLPDYVLEGAVAVLHRACLTGRKYIGPNAITEGALKLAKETGAVITESMLDAALNSVQHGKGLVVVKGILEEALKKAPKAPVVTESKKETPAAAPAKKVVTEAKKTVAAPAKKVVTEAKKPAVAAPAKTAVVQEAKCCGKKKAVAKKACKKCGK